MPVLLSMVGLIAVVLALVAVVRGHLDWARIKTRKAAAVALAVSFAVMTTGASWGAATTTTTQNPTSPPLATSSSVPTPTTTTTPPPAPPTTTTHRPVTTVAPPPVTQRTTVAYVPPPGPALTCSASMSDATPADYSTTDVLVQTGVSGASVTAIAHYKTTNTTHTVTAGGNGSADVPFRISDATPGYTVDVDVDVTAGGADQSCSTSFTPVR
jgi:hypothetical protein